MQQESLPAKARKLEKYIMTLPAAKQQNTLSTGPRKAMADLSDSTYGLRINAERYFNADDTDEKKQFLEAAIEHNKAIQKQILTASQYDLLGPADVAHLSALAEEILERLQ